MTRMTSARRPQGGRGRVGDRWIGRCRRPRRRSPRAPHGYDPTPPAGGPVLGRARLMPVGADTLTQLYAERSQQLGSWAGGQGGTPDGLVTSPAVTSPAGRAGAP